MKKYQCVDVLRQMKAFQKKELIRIVRTPEHTIEIDETGKKNGRGAYLKRSVEAVEIAKKRKSLARSLECEIPDEVYERLKEMFSE